MNEEGVSPGRVFVVTGGGGPGIGSACCRALCAPENTIWVTDVDEQSARRVAEGIGDGGRWLRMDVADPNSIATGINAVLAESGRIDGLVNSAGVTLIAASAEMPLEDFERLYAVNVRGPWLCARAVIPSMIENGGGCIVNIGSYHAQGAKPKFSAYAASKAALLALTRGISSDYGQAGIRCNSVSPGRVPAVAPIEEVAGFQSYTLTSQMLPVVIEPEDVGSAVAFLMSGAAKAISGVDIVVDAGTVAMLQDRRG